MTRTKTDSVCRHGTQLFRLINATIICLNGGMTVMLKRRTVLSVGGGMLAVVAGCLGGDETESETEDEDMPSDSSVAEYSFMGRQLVVEIANPSGAATIEFVDDQEDAVIDSQETASTVEFEIIGETTGYPTNGVRLDILDSQGAVVDSDEVLVDAENRIRPMTLRPDIQFTGGVQNGAQTELSFYNTGGPGYIEWYEVANTLTESGVSDVDEDLEPEEWLFIGHEEEITVEIDGPWYPEDSERFPPLGDNPCETTADAFVRVTTTTYGPEADSETFSGEIRHHEHHNQDLELGGEKITDGSDLTCTASTIEPSFEPSGTD